MNSSSATNNRPAFGDFRRRNVALSKISQTLVMVFLVACGAFSLAITIGIIVMLTTQSMGFFFNEEVGVNFWNFLTDTRWTIGQTQGTPRYGILPLLSGTMRITGIAMLISLPVGLICAVYLAEYATPKVRSILKPVLEILAGVPTVVLGFFAIKFITPWLLQPLGDFKTFNAGSAGIAVGILCLPLVTSLAEDALRSVPNALREGAYGLGSTRLEVTLKVVLPAALSGIISAFLLALSRAIGETMVVALAAGSTPTLTADPRAPSQTMTGFIVETFQSESIEPDSIGYYSMYVVAAVLFLFTFSITLVGQLLRMRYQEVYN